MLLTMQSNGFLSKKFETQQLNGYVDINRLSDEDKVWIKLEPGDGIQLNPVNYLTDVVAEGGHYKVGMKIDARVAKPGDVSIDNR